MREQPSGKFDIHTASIETIESATGISRELAERIVERRPYRRHEDLLRVTEVVEGASVDELTALTLSPPETPPPNFPLPVSESTSVTHESGVTYGVATELDDRRRVFLRSPDGNELLSAGIRDERGRGGGTLDYASIRILSWPPASLLLLSPKTRSRMQAVLHSEAASTAARLWQLELSGVLDAGTADLVRELSQIFSVFLDFTQTVAHQHAPDEECDTNGCTGVPDFNFEECCNEHDRCYCRGGTEADRLECDEQLYECIKSMGHPVLAWIYYLGVRALGGPHFNYETGEGDQDATPTVEPSSDEEVREGDCRVTAELLRVQYDGNDIGNDFSFDVAVDGEEESFGERTVDHGTSDIVGETVYSEEKGDCGERVSIDLYAEAREHDAIWDEVGSNSAQVWFDCPGTYEHELEVTLTETYYGTARLTFVFEIETECVA